MNKIKYRPKTKKELISCIKKEIHNQGWEADLNCIDTSFITDMSFLFASEVKEKEFDIKIESYGLSKFNGDISRWDLSNVKSTRGMFAFSEFNGLNTDFSLWGVSSVEDMSYMFAYVFFKKASLENWNVSCLKESLGMFLNCAGIEEICFSKWNLCNIQILDFMFAKSDFDSDKNGMLEKIPFSIRQREKLIFLGVNSNISFDSNIKRLPNCIFSKKTLITALKEKEFDLKEILLKTDYKRFPYLKKLFFILNSSDIKSIEKYCLKDVRKETLAKFSNVLDAILKRDYRRFFIEVVTKEDFLSKDEIEELQTLLSIAVVEDLKKENEENE